MKYSLIILNALLPFISCIKDADLKEMEVVPSECEKLLKELANENGLFSNCVIHFAVPVRMCKNCLIDFNNLTSAYNKTYEKCRKEYFDNNRANIIENMYLGSKAVWNKAFCERCSPDEIGHIEETIGKINSCIKDHGNSSCEKCRDLYETANAIYNKLSQKNDGKVCYDIQDSINKTRIMWSKELKCCQRVPNLNAFIALSSSFSILPILFYGGILYYIKRRGNNIETLNTDFERENNHRTLRNTQNQNSRMISSQTNTESQSQPQPNTSLATEEEEALFFNTKNKKKNHDSDESDEENDDDDDILS